MKVRELIEILYQCDLNAEVKVLFPLPNRPIGGKLEPIFKIEPCIEQDSNKTQYIIDTGIGKVGRFEVYQNNKKDV